jgi:hypothetical protein
LRGISIDRLRAAGVSDTQIVNMLREADAEYREKERKRKQKQRPCPAESAEGAETAEQKKPRAKREPRSRGPLPENWAPEGILSVEDTAELSKFRDYCAAHDKRYADPKAAFRLWLRSPYRPTTGQPREVINADELEARRNAIREVERRKNGGLL